ncbi:MAG TPA: class I SAM-dependent methyltransferase [Thermoanaerobaculia bacterium]|jgi:SAM-dependent methyltransferase|nr:class I SAM-dependent methyltransferase [Thermoanaerobaculia bacterium]
MTAAESYGAFAYAYDQALGERYFRSVRRLLVEMLDRYPVKSKTHLDVACGTGLAMPFFAARGFVSIGVDISPVMLNVARKRAKTLVLGDTRALPFRGTFARVTCLYDSLNHLLDPCDLATAFGEIANVMDAESLFIFDMNHPEIYPAVWGMKEPFIDEGRDFHLEIATTYRRRELLGRALVTGWAMVGSERIKIRERHTQRCYERNEIIAALAEGGLDAVEIRNFDPWSEGRVVKLVFVCRKRA